MGRSQPGTRQEALSHSSYCNYFNNGLRHWLASHQHRPCGADQKSGSGLVDHQPNVTARFRLKPATHQYSLGSHRGAVRPQSATSHEHHERHSCQRQPRLRKSKRRFDLASQWTVAGYANRAPVGNPHRRPPTAWPGKYRPAVQNLRCPRKPQHSHSGTFFGHVCCPGSHFTPRTPGVSGTSQTTAGIPTLEKRRVRGARGHRNPFPGADLHNLRRFARDSGQLPGRP